MHESMCYAQFLQVHATAPCVHGSAVSETGQPVVVSLDVWQVMSVFCLFLLCGAVLQEAAVHVHAR